MERLGTYRQYICLENFVFNIVIVAFWVLRELKYWYSVKEFMRNTICISDSRMSCVQDLSSAKQTKSGLDYAIFFLRETIAPVYIVTQLAVQCVVCAKLRLTLQQ